MTSFRYLLAFASILVVGSSAASAQGIEHEDHGTDAALCGMSILGNVDSRQALENTARYNPALYQRIIAHSSGKYEPARVFGAESDVEFDFKMYNYDLNQYKMVTSALLYTGIRFRLWCDINELDRVSESKVLQFAKYLDSSTVNGSRDIEKGILENDQEVFGMPPLNRFDLPISTTITDFLLTDIRDGIPSGASVEGYFSPIDQQDPVTNPASNGMNILYIDINSIGNINNIMGTLAHEYQHLIHYNRNKNTLTFFNEGCSEEASIRNGYYSRTDALYMDEPNIDFFRWSRDRNQPQEILKDYTRALTFTHYLSERFGDQYLYELVGSTADSMNRVNDALQKIGRTDIEWRQIFKNFAAALYVTAGEAPAPEFAFIKRPTASRPKMTQTFESGDVTANMTTNLKPFGIAYYMYKTPPGGLKLNFTNDGDFAVVAMMYKKIGDDAEIRELTPDTDHLLSAASQSYVRIVLAVINMSGVDRNVKWTAALQTLGVDDAAAAASGLSMATVAPNPVSTITSITFTTAAPAPLTLGLYDSRGALVRTLIDGRQYESGEHTITSDLSDLPNGVYLARLTQNEHAVSTSIVVVK